MNIRKFRKIKIQWFKIVYDILSNYKKKSLYNNPNWFFISEQRFLLSNIISRKRTLEILKHDLDFGHLVSVKNIESHPTKIIDIKLDTNYRPLEILLKLDLIRPNEEYMFLRIVTNNSKKDKKIIKRVIKKFIKIENNKDLKKVECYLSSIKNIEI